MKNVLVIDDQVTVRRLVEMTLQAHGINVLQAESGEKGVEVAQRESPDLIIMDIMMPGGMDGFETVHVLRNQEGIRDCPIIMLTAKDQKPERERAFEAGVDDYLAKPFKLKDLIRKVENLLEQVSSHG